MRTVAVVGASLAGLSAARALREQSYPGRVVIVGAERHRPYDRPPLSKGFLTGTCAETELALTTSDDDALELDWRLGSPAVRLDRASRTLTLDTGEEIRADGVVIATGARARLLPGMDDARGTPAGGAPGTEGLGGAHGAGGMAGVHVLRTLEDALALPASLLRAERLVVIGAGLSDVLADGGTEGALFGLLAQFPLATVTSIVVVTLITLFFVSSADSASVVLGMQSQGGNLAPHRALVVLWGCMIAVTGAVLLLAGGLSAMQTVSILVATPFLVILAAVCVTLVRQLREEPVTATVPEGVYSVVREHSGGAHAPRPAAAPPAEPEPAPVPPPRDRVAR